MSERTPLLVFLKPPVPGMVKTRLAASLGEEPAARLYRAFLQDLLARVATSTAFMPTLCVAGDAAHPALDGALQGLPPWPRREQLGATLGERMTEALTWAQSRGSHALLIGSDLPTLPLARLHEAVSALHEGTDHEGIDHEGTDAVFGPCDDGGYYLVGARSSARPPLTDPSIRYSTAHTLADTERACARAGLATRRLLKSNDVDDIDDLNRLAHQLEQHSNIAPNTASLLRSLR